MATVFRFPSNMEGRMAHRLLLADDSITIQKVVELTLSEEDFNVTAVSDGEAALDTARKSAPDIILADVFMPKMDGYQLCGKLKQDPALRDIPVILLAGTFEDFDDALAARVGADDHLTKPFESAELISMVKRLVERPKAAPQPVIMPQPQPAIPEPQLAAFEPQPFKAGPAEAAFMPEEVEKAAPVEIPGEADDLWSVVDMQSDDQPLADATAILTEDDLWRRANLVSMPGQRIDIPASAAEYEMPWDPPQAESKPEEAAFMDASPVEDDGVLPSVPLDEEEEAAEATAILNLDDLGGPSLLDAEPEDASGPERGPVDLAEVAEDAPIFTFDSLQDASLADDFLPKRDAGYPAFAAAPIPAAAPVGSAPASKTTTATPEVSVEDIKAEVARAVSEALDAKVREALSSLGREAIERIVWEVVPDLAEEILVKEIEKLKAGI